MSVTLTCQWLGLVVLGLLNTALYAADTVKIAPEHSLPQEVPDKIIKLCPVIDTMIEDLGGYSAQHFAAAPIPVPGISGIHFSELVIFLKTVTTEYDEYSKSLDLKKVPSLASYNALEAVLSEQDGTRLLHLVIAANFLNMSGLIQLGAKILAKNYLGMKNVFNNLEEDLKAVILSQLTPKEFMAWVDINMDLDVEETFKIALKVHYENMPLPDSTAKAFYESLRKSSGFVRIPGGEYLIGSPKKKQIDIRTKNFTLSG